MSNTTNGTASSTIAMDAINPPVIPTTKPVSKPKLPTDNMAKEMASQAFREDKEGRKQVGTAEQRMAYAIAIHDANEGVRRSNAPRLNCTSDDDKKTLRKSMVTYFCGETPNKKKLAADKGTQYAITVIKAHTAYKALVTKGLTIAVACQAHGIGWQAFDTDTGCMTVKATMMIPEGCQPLGRLAKGEAIALDGRPVTFLSKARNGDEYNDGALANVGHLLRCIGPKPKGKEAKPGEAAAFEAMVAAVKEHLVSDAPSEPIKATDYSDDLWNNLTAILQAVDEMRNSVHFLDKQDDKEPSPIARAFAKAA